MAGRKTSTAMNFTQTQKSASRAGALLSSAAFCASLLLAPNLWNKTREVLTLALESRFARTDATSSDTLAGIIALGGSHERVVEAVRLARQFPDAKLVVTGASPEDQAYAQAQGFSDSRLLVEPDAKTTYQNAIFSRRLLGPEQRQKWLIVTSAIHMPRAIGAFREAGFSVLPWPVFDRADLDPAATRVTLHEVFGLLDYWILGRIDSLFPAPNA